MSSVLIKDKIDSLPENLRQEVEDFIEFLLQKNNFINNNKEVIPSFNWAGELKELKEKYTSVELQHLISEWR